MNEGTNTRRVFSEHKSVSDKPRKIGDKIKAFRAFRSTLIRDHARGASFFIVSCPAG